MGDDSLLGLSVYQQLAVIGAIGVVLVFAGYSMESAISSTYNPTVVMVGAVCVLYALARSGYELFAGA